MKLKNCYLLVFAMSLVCSHVAMANEVRLFNQKTLGNHSYVRIGVDKTPDEYSSQILAILEEFEKLNPDKDVVGWKVEKQQVGYTTLNHIFGLWIDHKPKVK